MEIKVQSLSFKNGEYIPSKYASEGENVSPNLKWSIPQSETGIKTFLVTAENSGPPSKNLVHWIVYNIPVTITELHEDVTPSRNVPDEIQFGTNDFGHIGYSGPKQNKKTHKYYFNVYGLDCAMHLDAGAMIKQVLEKIEGHIIAHGRLTGKYKNTRTS